MYILQLTVRKTSEETGSVSRIYTGTVVVGRGKKNDIDQ